MISDQIELSIFHRPKSKVALVFTVFIMLYLFWEALVYIYSHKYKFFRLQMHADNSFE